MINPAHGITKFSVHKSKNSLAQKHPLSFKLYRISLSKCAVLHKTSSFFSIILLVFLLFFSFCPSDSGFPFWDHLWVILILLNIEQSCYTEKILCFEVCENMRGCSFFRGVTLFLYLLFSAWPIFPLHLTIPMSPTHFCIWFTEYFWILVFTTGWISPDNFTSLDKSTQSQDACCLHT